MSNNQYFPSWINKAEELYKNGTPYYKIGNELGVSRKTVSYYLRELGYKSNPLYARQVDPKKLTKYSYNESYFSIIDTEEKAYWLGFLYADGDISRFKHSITLALKESDYDHLVKFKQSLDLPNKITQKIKYDKKTEKTYYGYTIGFTCQSIHQDLINLGCTPRKSLTLKFPEEDKVPKTLQRHFIRGYFDGDGCILKTHLTVNLLGTYEFLDKCMECFGLHKNKISLCSNHNQTYSITYSGIFAEHILHYLYDDATIYLDRKYKLYKKYLPSSIEAVKD